MYYYCTSVLYYCITTVLLLYYCATTVLLYYCTTTVLLLYYYCTTTVLLYYCCTTKQYQASDFVDCGGECKLEGKVFKIKGF